MGPEVGTWGQQKLMLCTYRCVKLGVYVYVYIYTYISGQIIATSAEVTPNGSLVRDSPNNALNSGLGIIVIWPDIYMINLETYLY